MPSFPKKTMRVRGEKKNFWKDSQSKGGEWVDGGQNFMRDFKMIYFLISF